jgi:hypothetical protein
MAGMLTVGRRQWLLKVQAVVFFGIFCFFPGIGMAAGEEGFFVLGGIGAGFFLAGMLCVMAIRRAPTKEIMHLAKERGGLLTLGEITLSLDVDPSLASRALAKLHKLNCASPRWQEIRKNLWEFPDYLELPLEQSLKLAEKSGGRLRLKDLLAQGYSLDTAQQTLDALAREGLAQVDPGDATSVQVAMPA